MFALLCGLRQAYGDAGVGPIPPRADLTFELELLETRDDTCDKFKWQLLGAVLFILVVVLSVPYLQSPSVQNRM